MANVFFHLPILNSPLQWDGIRLFDNTYIFHQGVTVEEGYILLFWLYMYVGPKWKFETILI